MEKLELVFIPFPAMGHMISAVEVAKLLVQRHEHLSITFLIMRIPFTSEVDKYIESLTAIDRINFINLPDVELDLDPAKLVASLMRNQRPHVKEAVSKHMTEYGESARLAGFVVDIVCMEMVEVAHEFGVPSYSFFITGAAYLGFLYCIQALHDEHNVSPTELQDSDSDLSVPTLKNPLPAKALPSVVLGRDFPSILSFARRLRKTKGVIVNTFQELETNAISSLSNGETPPVYPVGPILNLKAGSSGGQQDKKYEEIMQWLDNQPPSSVVFLCFGSLGSFSENQAKEIASALEHSGHRFLWSFRRRPPQDKVEYPSDYENIEEGLPEGFLDRTAGIGKVIGWAPQVAVLGHPAIGGFVTHCGWNSMLESIWFGVPMAAWPLYAEHHFSAFLMVKELGLASEIRMDYRQENADEMLVSAGEIEKGINSLMEQDSEMRKKVKEMSKKSTVTLLESGPSYSSLGRFVQDAIKNIS